MTEPFGLPAPGIAGRFFGVMADFRSCDQGVAAHGHHWQLTPYTTTLHADGNESFDDCAILTVEEIYEVPEAQICAMEWVRISLKPSCPVNPWAASAIAEGALMGHECGAKCFERYRKDLNV